MGKMDKEKFRRKEIATSYWNIMFIRNWNIWKLSRIIFKIINNRIFYSFYNRNKVKYKNIIIIILKYIKLDYNI
jgi:hypothetical protein